MSPEPLSPEPLPDDSATRSRRACVFAHFDQDDDVDEYVYWYINELLTVCGSLVFVTVSKISQEQQQRLGALGINVVVRENVGYDFMSYRLGIEQLSLPEFDELVLCNDSVYGPVYPLRQLFELMQQRSADFWGATDSYELKYHLQSFFLVFRASALNAPAFIRFWREVSIIPDKRRLVEAYEIGLTQSLITAGLEADSVFSSHRTTLITRMRNSPLTHLKTVARRFLEPDFWRTVSNVLFRGHTVAVNSMHSEWKALLLVHRVPFLKVALLRENPRGLRPEMPQVSSTLLQLGTYPVELIERHQQRVRRC